MVINKKASTMEKNKSKYINKHLNRLFTYREILRICHKNKFHLYVANKRKSKTKL